MTDRADEASRPLSEDEAAELAAYLDGRLTPAASQALEQRLLSSDRLAVGLYEEMTARGALAALADARAHPGELRANAPAARSASARRVRPRWLRARVLLPAAAAVALAIVLPRLLTGPSSRPPVLRGGERAPMGLTGVGDLTVAPETFAWTVDPLADRYRFRLYDHGGRLLYESTTREASTTLPPGAVDWQRVSEGSWVVTPLAGDGTERPPSLPQRFRLAPR